MAPTYDRPIFKADLFHDQACANTKNGDVGDISSTNSLHVWGAFRAHLIIEQSSLENRSTRRVSSPPLTRCCHRSDLMYPC